MGFNIRQYKIGKNNTKLLIKPSKESAKKAKATIKDIFSKKRGRPVKELIAELNPVIILILIKHQKRKPLSGSNRVKNRVRNIGNGINKINENVFDRRK